jgi:choline kinase
VVLGCRAMKAVILAAGASTRLRPYTNEKPKSLLPVAGVPILKRALDHLLAVGVTEIAIVTGFLEHMIRDAAAGWAPGAKLHFFTNADYATTQNGPSLLLARPAVDGHEFIMLDADIVFERSVLTALLDGPPDCLALRPADDLSDEEIKVLLDSKGFVKLIDKTVPPRKAAGESIGIERFSAATSKILFETLHDRVVNRGLTHEWYEKAFEEMIAAKGVQIRTVDVGGAYCAEIDTPDDLHAADQALRERGL